MTRGSAFMRAKGRLSHDRQRRRSRRVVSMETMVLGARLVFVHWGDAIAWKA